MKTKNLVIIFILFLLITLASGLAVFLTEEKNQQVLNEQTSAVEKQAKLTANKPAIATTTALKNKKIIAPVKNSPFYAKPKETVQPEIAKQPVEEKIKAVTLINGLKYETAVKPGSSVYDLMGLLKGQNKIDFKGKNYAGIGFFVEVINGLKNNSAGANWLYYINGQPATVGISNYLINNNDIIEWKYEKKSF